MIGSATTSQIDPFGSFFQKMHDYTSSVSAKITEISKKTFHSMGALLHLLGSLIVGGAFLTGALIIGCATVLTIVSLPATIVGSFLFYIKLISAACFFI